MKLAMNFENSHNFIVEKPLVLFCAVYRRNQVDMRLLKMGGALAPMGMILKKGGARGRYNGISAY